MRSFIISLFFATAFNAYSSNAGFSYFSRCPIDDPNEVVAFCTGENNLGITFPAKTSSENVRGFFGGAVGCLVSTPSPSWFIMQIEDEGDLYITMNHSERQDIDFACWGPFSGNNKADVLSKVCSDPDTYFKSPSSNGDPHINLCEMEYNQYLDSVLTACFFEKTGVDLPLAVTDEFGEWLDPSYMTVSGECFDYALATVPAELENRYTQSIGQDPTAPENEACYILQDESDIMMVSCSYSSSDIENCMIRDAKKGDWYILLITNYSQMPGDIFFNKTGGTASTNCKIIVDATTTGPYCEGDDIRFVVNNAPENATFHWWGPNGFDSDEKSPLIKSATKADAGSYFVTMHSGDVTSDKVEVTVVVGTPTLVDTTVIIKPGESYDFAGKRISESGSYTATLTSEEGCDSIVNLNLVVSNSNVVLFPVSPVCEGETIVLKASVDASGEDCVSKWTGPGNFSSSGKVATIENASLEMAGTYTFSFTASGEKTEKEMKVAVFPKTKVEKEVLLLKGETISFGEGIISGEGTYTHIFQSAAGCDSVVTLNVKTSSVTIDNTGPYCEGETIQLTSEGLPEGQLIEWRGPDGFTSDLKAPAIENANGQHAGIYSLYVKNDGAETLVGKTDVVVWENVLERLLLQLAKGDTIHFGELTIDKAGEYTQTYVSAAGCDSVVSLSVRIKPDEKSVIRPDGFFSPNGDGVNDKWQIENIDLYANAIVHIYDRHGKQIRKFDAYCQGGGWDGTDDQGSPLPSTDYWFTIDISEIDRVYVGHVTLLR